MAQVGELETLRRNGSYMPATSIGANSRTPAAKVTAHAALSSRRLCRSMVATFHRYPHPAPAWRRPNRSVEFDIALNSGDAAMTLCYRSSCSDLRLPCKTGWNVIDMPRQRIAFLDRSQINGRLYQRADRACNIGSAVES